MHAFPLVEEIIVKLWSCRLLSRHAHHYCALKVIVLCWSLLVINCLYFYHFPSVAAIILSLFQDTRTWKCHLVPFECRSGSITLLAWDFFSHGCWTYKHREPSAPCQYCCWTAQPVPALCKTTGHFCVINHSKEYESFRLFFFSTHGILRKGLTWLKMVAKKYDSCCVGRPGSVRG